MCDVEGSLNSPRDVQVLPGGAASFRHSGKLGDAVYCLAAVRSFQVADIYLSCGSFIGKEEASLLLPLLKMQPYIRHADIWAGQSFEYDLDVFRAYASGYNLADSHLIPLGLPPTWRDEPWLTIDFSTSYEKGPVIFSRTLRYPGVAQFWEVAYAELGSQAAFVGTPDEHRAFTLEVGEVPYVPTADLLDLARIIAGSRLFVGNQSCALSIAEGLKRPLIQEVCIESPNCLFYRSGHFPITALWQFKNVFNEISRQNYL